jgi:transposase
METSLARDLMSDDAWGLFERFILAVRAPNGRKPLNHRLVLDGIFWIARTGSPWRDLPEEFGKWSSVYRQFRRWTLGGAVGADHGGAERKPDCPGRASDDR